MKDNNNLMIVRSTIREPIEDMRIYIPVNADRDKVLETLRQCCHGLTRVADAEERLRLVIGKSLWVVKLRKLFRPEHHSFNQFLRTEIQQKYHISRSTLYEAMKIVKTFPALTAQEYDRIGFMKLARASHVITRNQMRGASARRLLTDAARMSLEEFDAHYADGRKKKAGTAIVIRTSRRFARAWQEFCADRDQQEVLAALMIQAEAGPKKQAQASQAA